MSRFSALLRWLPLALLLVALAGLFASQWDRWPSDARGVWDTRRYLEIASGLRTGHLSPALSVFPPGYPLLLAVMPAAVNMSLATTASMIAFLAAVVCTYGLALRLTNRAGAILAASCWLLVFLRWPHCPRAPLSDNLFVAVMVGALWAQAPVLRGALAGFGALVRPEGLAFAALLAAQGGAIKRAVVIGAVAACLYLPYVVALHHVSGHWQISGKVGRNLHWAPYYAGGCDAAERRALAAAFEHGPPPSPRDPRVAELLPPSKVIAAQRMESPGPRIAYNLVGPWASWLRSSFPLYLLALGGTIVALLRRRFSLVIVGFTLVGITLTWLPYYFPPLGDRLMLPALAGMGILASGLGLAHRSHGD